MEGDEVQRATGDEVQRATRDEVQRATRDEVQKATVIASLLVRRPLSPLFIPPSLFFRRRRRKALTERGSVHCIELRGVWYNAVAMQGQESKKWSGLFTFHTTSSSYHLCHTDLHSLYAGNQRGQS